jgi:AraC family transcriptional regulator, positive regulator of tynA and feaB
MNMNVATSLILPPVLHDIIKLSTDEIRPHERMDFWREKVCRMFAEVEITSRLGGDFHGEMIGRSWVDMRLTHVAAQAESVARVRKQAQNQHEDCYFAVILLAGNEFVEQDGREVLLRPGDMTIYDATRPHRLNFPEHFQKLILQIPRRMLQERIVGIEQCTAMSIPGTQGAGAIASTFFKSFARHVNQLTAHELTNFSEQAIDLLAVAVASVRPVDIFLSRSRSLSLCRAKAFIEHHLSNPDLDTAMVASGSALSPRYTNKLFEDEGTSLMRYVLKRRLERCRNDMIDPCHFGRRVYDIALRWGFNHPSHFTRAFKKHFGVGPRDFCHLHREKTF